MVDPLEALPVKVQAIEDKLDALGASVEARFEVVNARFDAVDARFDQLRPFDLSPVGTFRIRVTCRVPDRKRSG